MKRANPTAILTADWHLRDTRPVCRTDNFWDAQWRKVRFIQKLQSKYGCLVIHAGDLFDHWKPSPLLLSSALLNLPEQFWTIYGNHDLPQHSLDLSHKSGVHTLISANRVSLFDGTHWEQEPSKPLEIEGRTLLVWHIMTYTGKSPWPDCPDPPAERLLKQYPDIDLILTGHNHKSFVIEKEGRLLVNPGLITRQKANEKDYEPSVYLWYAKTNRVERVIIPYTKDVIVGQEQEKKREQRYQAFIRHLKSEEHQLLSFKENLERFFKQYRTVPSVKKLILEKME